jgi:RNA polymerase sigma-70 factor (ECF subfamily)
MLGISVSGVKSRVQRGRQRIRQMFEQCCELSLDCRGHVSACVPRQRGELDSAIKFDYCGWRRDR